MVESTQIRWFSRQSGIECWSGRAIVKQRPRVSNLGLKGLSNYHSTETGVEAARREASVPNKGQLSRNIYSEERAGEQLKA